MLILNDRFLVIIKALPGDITMGMFFRVSNARSANLVHQNSICHENAPNNHNGLTSPIMRNPTGFLPSDCPSLHSQHSHRPCHQKRRETHRQREAKHGV